MGNYLAPWAIALRHGQLPLKFGESNLHNVTCVMVQAVHNVIANLHDHRDVHTTPMGTQLDLVGSVMLPMCNTQTCFPDSNYKTVT